MKRLIVLTACLLHLWAGVAFAQVGISFFPGPGMPAATTGGMGTPLIASSGTNAPSTSAVNYTYPANGNAAAYFTATNSSIGGGPEALMAAAGTVSGLSVVMSVAVAGGTQYTVAIVKNSVIQGELCQITSAATTCTDAVNTVTFAVGDFLSYAVCPGTISGTTCTPGTAPASQTSGVQISSLFTSTTAGQSPIFSSIGGNNFTSGNFMGWGLWGQPSQATENVAASNWPTGGTISNFFVNTQTAPGTGSESHVFTVQQNGSPTAITCTIASSATLTSCSDTTHSITVATNDNISVNYTIGLGAPAGPGHVSVAALWTPTIPGEAVVFNRSDSGGFPGTSGTSFFYFTGRSTFGSGTEVASFLQVVPVGMTVKKLNFAIAPAPGGATTRAITLRQGNGTQSSTALTCTITSAATGCTDTTHSSSATLGQFLDWQNTLSGTNAALTQWRIGAVMTVP